MTHPLRSTIAQMLFLSVESLDFHKVVADLQSVMIRNREEALQIHWDCDDVVSFDIGPTRILLAWSQQARGGYGACLTISVGPADLQGAGSLDLEVSRGILCSRLVEEVRHRSRPVGIIWREMDGLMDAEVSDTLADLLPPVESILGHVAQTDLYHHSARIDRQRIWPRDTAPGARSPRPPMLRRLAGQVISVAGVLLALTQAPLGQSLRAFANPAPRGSEAQIPSRVKALHGG